jgi:hypothetical protein
MNRCARHIRVRTHNLNAAGGAEECGACIMEEVYFLLGSRLDILEVLADSLRRGSQLRSRVSELEMRLDFFGRQGQGKPS